MLRYNKSGKFNIPFGRYKTMNYSDIENCEDYHELLGRTSICCDSFEKIFEEYDDDGNFIFLDPPYDFYFLRITDTASSIKMITNVCKFA